MDLTEFLSEFQLEAGEKLDTIASHPPFTPAIAPVVNPPAFEKISLMYIGRSAMMGLSEETTEIENF